MVGLDSSNLELEKLKLELKITKKAAEMRVLEETDDLLAFKNNEYHEQLTAKINDAISSETYEIFDGKLNELIPWVYTSIPEDEQLPLLDRIAVLKYSMQTLKSKAEYAGNSAEDPLARTTNYGCDFGCEGTPLQQYQLDNTLYFVNGAPDGCYPVFDRSDCFLIRNEGEMIIKHCPEGTKYNGNCGCESVSWWDSWGRCAAAIVSGGGAGALTGAAVGSATVFGIPVGGVAGAVIGAVGGVWAGCWTPE